MWRGRRGRGGQRLGVGGERRRGGKRRGGRKRGRGEEVKDEEEVGEWRRRRVGGEGRKKTRRGGGGGRGRGKKRRRFDAFMVVFRPIHSIKSCPPPLRLVC